ncbi:MAG: flippase-like domain-containing protein [Acidobacteria bacterium]|nr:flippase-like domain-containing protein [Acidobacteriota bacterium]
MTNPRRSRALKVAISLSLAALLLFFFFRSLDFAAVGRAIGEAHAGWLALALFISVATLPFRSWRWTVLLQSVGRVPQRDANVATTIGFAASTLLPARAGEVVRPYVLADRLKLPFAPVLASVAFERLLDLLSVILLFVVYALGWVPSGLGEAEASRFAKLRGSAFLVGAVAIVGLAVAVFLARKPERLGIFLRFVPRRIQPRFESLAQAFLSGMGGVHSARDALVIASASIFLWLVLCVQVYASLRAFGIDQPFPVAFFVLTWSVLGLAIPTPGGVGGYHAAITYALTAFYGVDRNVAAAMALVSHAISFVPVTLIGLVCLVATGLSLGKLANEGGGKTGEAGGNAGPTA